MLWCPEAIPLPFNGPSGGTFVRAPARGVLHTTESNRYVPSRDDYYGHKNPPHFTVTREGQAYQHYPINVASRALLHPRRTPQTNRMNAYQIEVVGYASRTQWPTPQILRLKEIMRWLERHTGIRRVFPLPWYGADTGYGTSAPSRMSDKEWAKFSAWCGHQHVPNNSHWDPGKLPDELAVMLLQPASWSEPGDPVLVGTDAVKAARYQGGADQARIVGQIEQEEVQIMIGRVLDLDMQHDARLRALE